MTQEDKQLLLKDLCVRLPYGVKIHINSCIEEQNHMQLFDVNLEVETIGVRNEKWAFRAIPIIDDEEETKVIKPYLRPMSSMTKEEEAELMKLGVCEYAFHNDIYDVGTYVDEAFTALSWLFERHFDVNGLIEKGLAIEAPEGMYSF